MTKASGNRLRQAPARATIIRRGRIALRKRHSGGPFSTGTVEQCLFFSMEFALLSEVEMNTDNCTSKSLRFKWWRSQESEPTLYIQKTPQRTTREDSKAASSRQNKWSTMKILLILPGAQCGYSSSTKVCALKFLKKMLSTFSR